MSFLTQGKWSRAALILGFEPLAVVQRALVTGALKTPEPESKKTPAQLMRELRARRKAAGLTAVGKPKRKFLKVHPELRGLSRREYLTRFARLRRGQPSTGPIRPYRKAVK